MTPEDKVTAAVRLPVSETGLQRLLELAAEATIPVILIVVALLFVRDRWILLGLSAVGAVISAVGFGRLLSTVTYDIAGSPDVALPIWAVLYLAVYLVVGFAFVIFGLHLWSPGVHFGGSLSGITPPNRAFLDSLYLSLTNYIAVPPDPSLVLRTQLPRYLSVVEGMLSLFVNAVILTKFVMTF